MANLNMAKLCCVCLASSEAATHANWQNIFMDTDLIFLLEQATGQVVKPAEDLPERICPTCLTAAQIALKFKQRFERSVKFFSEQNEPQKKTFSNSRNKPFVCPHCFMHFNYKCKLKVHLRIHTGQGPHKCSSCSKTFSFKCDLTRHSRTHFGERPFKCSQCPMAFKLSSALTRHLIIHNAERPFKCSHCSKGFNQKGDLAKHLRTHTGERPFECSHCLKSFTLKRALLKHLLTHTEDYKEFPL